jgi:hypothetical protein
MTQSSFSKCPTIPTARITVRSHLSLLTRSLWLCPLRAVARLAAFGLAIPSLCAVCPARSISLEFGRSSATFQLNGRTLTGHLHISNDPVTEEFEFPSAAMSSQAAAEEVDPHQLPRVLLITGDNKEAVNRSITQISKTEVKGGQGGAGRSPVGSPMGSMAALGMRAGMGSGGLSELSMLGGLGGMALRFAPLAAGPGMIIAAPAMSLAMGGGLTHHSSAPKATYVWALLGAHSAYAMAATKPRFEIGFGDIVGLDPDAYEPALVKLTQGQK